MDKTNFTEEEMDKLKSVAEIIKSHPDCAYQVENLIHKEVPTKEHKPAFNDCIIPRNIAEMIIEYLEGKSFQEIANKRGFTRQFIEQNVHRYLTVRQGHWSIEKHPYYQNLQKEILKKYRNFSKFCKENSISYAWLMARFSSGSGIMLKDALKIQESLKADIPLRVLFNRDGNVKS